MRGCVGAWVGVIHFVVAATVMSEDFSHDPIHLVVNHVGFDFLLLFSS